MWRSQHPAQPFGKRFYSTYIALTAPFKLGGLDWTAEVGLTPWEGTYADKFNVTNLTLAAAKKVPITSKFSLPLFTQVTFNPLHARRLLRIRTELIKHKQVKR